MCTPLTPGCPNVEPVRHHAHRRVAPTICAFAFFGFPNPRSTLHSPVSQTMKRAPYMVPDSHEAQRPRSCPRDRTDFTAQVAHTMKPTLLLQFPKATQPTSCAGRLHHEAAAAVSVARRDDANLTARGSRTEEHLLLPVSRAKKRPTARCTRTAAPLRRPVSRAVKQHRLHGSPVFWSPLHPSGCPKR